MIIFGFKKIRLSNSQLSIPCAECGHEHQSLHIFRNFFSLYFFPAVPLKKLGIVSCPNCSTELKEKEFFKRLDAIEFNHEVKHRVKTAIKSAKTPFYWLIPPILLAICVMGFILMVRHEDELAEKNLTAYQQEPFGNVIVIFKSDTDAYPYAISYIPEIRGEYAAVFDWKYRYELLADAKRAIVLASKGIKEGKLKDQFGEPYIASREDFQSEAIVHVNRQDQLMEWKQYVPIEDPEGIMRLFNSEQSEDTAYLHWVLK